MFDRDATVLSQSARNNLWVKILLCCHPSVPSNDTDDSQRRHIHICLFSDLHYDYKHNRPSSWQRHMFVYSRATNNDCFLKTYWAAYYLPNNILEIIGGTWQHIWATGLYVQKCCLSRQVTRFWDTAQVLCVSNADNSDSFTRHAWH